MNNSNIFISDYFNECLLKYNELSSQKKEVAASEFGVHFIEVLIKIYSKIEILNPFLSKNEEAFFKKIKKYGLSDNKLNDFINNFEKLGQWSKEKIKTKTDIISKVEINLLDMVILKSRYQNLPISFLESFKNDFYTLENPRKLFSALNIMYFSDQNATLNYYYELKSILNTSNIVLTRKKTEALPNEYYLNNGLSLEEVAKLDDDALAKLNDTIMSSNNDVDATSGGRTTTISDMITKVLKPAAGATSGSGFVDALLLTGIIATVVMIIVVICVYFGVK